MHAITSNSAQHVTAADRNNAHGISNNLVAPTLMQCGRPIFFRSIALIGVLLAFGMGGVAQAQQPSAASFTAENTDGAARNVAVGEEQPAIPASTTVPNEPQSAAGLSKEIANPLSNLWLLQIQQNNTLMGKATYVQSNLQFQPLIPIPVSAHWSLISRPVIQVFSSQPYPVVTSVDHATHTATANIDRTTSLGDTVFATALSPDSSLVGKWLVAAGATFVFPTATHHALGQDTWQAGPTVALGYKGDKWLAFVFPQHWWKVGGSGKKTNQTLVQYNFSWNFDNGWSLGTSPNLTVNWEAPRNQRVSFPVGLQVGKLLHAGPMPVKVDVQAMYYAVRPTQAYPNYSGTAFPSPKWGFQLQFTPVIPPIIHGFKSQS